MTSWSDLNDEMRVVALDNDTVDRILAGAVAAEDAPPGYAGVVRFLEDLTGEPSAEEFAGEAEVVAMLAAAVRSTSNSSAPRRSFMPFALSRPRLAAALVAAGLACTSGLASAGALPGAAQDVASAMLAKVGITVPGPNDQAGTHPSTRGKSGTPPTNAGQGSEISELARTTELTGVEKGAAISTAASNGKSQAGEHGSAASSASQALIATPSTGGTGTADAASGGKSTAGTSVANTASSGRSSAGSVNAEAGRSTAASMSGGHGSAGSENAGSGESARP